VIFTFHEFYRICDLRSLQKKLTSLRLLARKTFRDPAELLPLAKIKY